MAGREIEIIFIVAAVGLAVLWWLVRPRADRRVLRGAGRISSRHRELLVRFRNVVNDERARERVLAYYQGKYPQDSIECVLEKILGDYHADNERVTSGRGVLR